LWKKKTYVVVDASKDLVFLGSLVIELHLVELEFGLVVASTRAALISHVFVLPRFF